MPPGTTSARCALAPFLWDYRGRVLLALAFLVLAKVATVAVPLVLKPV